MRLDDDGFAEAAFHDKALAKEVADWKSKLYRQRDRDGNWVDYNAAVTDKLQLVPDAEMREELKADYEAMIEAVLMLGDAMPFDDLMQRCEKLQERANSR